MIGVTGVDQSVDCRKAQSNIASSKLNIESVYLINLCLRLTVCLLLQPILTI